MEKYLKVLIARNMESQQAYASAAELVDNHNFRSFLRAYSKKHKVFADELSLELSNGNAADAYTDRTTDDSAEHFPVTDGSHDDRKVLKSLAHLEGRTLRDYDLVIGQKLLPQEWLKIIVRQRAKIFVSGKTMFEILPLLNGV